MLSGLPLSRPGVRSGRQDRWTTWQSGFMVVGLAQCLGTALVSTFERTVTFETIV